jgi:hypothetical protein
MFKLQYFDKNKLIGQFEYPTLDEAREAIDENDIWNDSTNYTIIDSETGDIEEEEEFEDTESINKMMFPDEESKEGFDVDDFFDNEK